MPVIDRIMSQDRLLFRKTFALFSFAMRLFYRILGSKRLSSFLPIIALFRPVLQTQVKIQNVTASARDEYRTIVCKGSSQKIFSFFLEIFLNKGGGVIYGIPNFFVKFW